MNVIRAIEVPPSASILTPLRASIFLLSEASRIPISGILQIGAFSVLRFLSFFEFTMLAFKTLSTVAKPLLSRWHYESIRIIDRGFVTIHFHSAKGETKTVQAEPGESILRVAQHNGIPLEGVCCIPP